MTTRRTLLKATAGLALTVGTIAEAEATFPGSEYLLPAYERGSLRDTARIIAIRDDLQAFHDDLDWPDEHKTRLRDTIAELNDAVISFCPHTSEAYTETATTLTCPFCRFTMRNPHMPLGWRPGDGPNAA
jgi:hypothetical protein